MNIQVKTYNFRLYTPDGCLHECNNLRVLVHLMHDYGHKQSYEVICQYIDMQGRYEVWPDLKIILTKLDKEVR